MHIRQHSSQTLRRQGQNIGMWSLQYRPPLPQGRIPSQGNYETRRSTTTRLTISIVATDAWYTHPLPTTTSLTPAGHEAAGTIAAIGKNVHNVSIGDRVTADPLQPCLSCFHCTRRKPLLCSSLTAFGGNVPGGFAEYCVYPARQVHCIGSLPALEAVLLEPAACATHGIERMQLDPGSRVLLFGCGPTGILLAQLMRLNGAAHVRNPFPLVARLTRTVDHCVQARAEAGARAPPRNRR